jgi:hypothetical protein
MMSPGAVAAAERGSIVACRECGVHQRLASADRLVRPHRRRQWSLGCRGSGQPGILLGPVEWFRTAPLGALILVGGDTRSTEDITCRSCRRVFRIARPAAGAFHRVSHVHVTCRHCNDCFPLRSLVPGPQGVWVPAGRVRDDEAPGLLVELT